MSLLCGKLFLVFCWRMIKNQCLNIAANHSTIWFLMFSGLTLVIIDRQKKSKKKLSMIRHVSNIYFSAYWCLFLIIEKSWKNKNFHGFYFFCVSLRLWKKPTTNDFPTVIMLKSAIFLKPQRERDYESSSFYFLKFI